MLSAAEQAADALVYMGVRTIALLTSTHSGCHLIPGVRRRHGLVSLTVSCHLLVYRDVPVRHSAGRHTATQPKSANLHIEATLLDFLLIRSCVVLQTSRLSRGSSSALTHTFV